MSKSTGFFEHLKQTGGKTIGEFENEFGERFVLYTLASTPKLVFITGDELDWGAGQILANSYNYAFMPFSFSKDEIKKLKEIKPYG